MDIINEKLDKIHIGENSNLTNNLQTNNNQAENKMISSEINTSINYESNEKKQDQKKEINVNIREENKLTSKPNDLKSLLEASIKKKNKPKESKIKKIESNNINKNSIKDLNQSNNINEKINVTTESYIKSHRMDDEWEEVKKGGARMKLVNKENLFDISSIGKIFEGRLKHDLETKGLSISKCLIEPFFVLSLDLAQGNLNNCFERFFSRKKVENISNPSASFHQRAFIEKLPRILILHVKGFYYDKKEHKVVKITKELDYEFDLKIKKESDSTPLTYFYRHIISSKPIQP